MKILDEAERRYPLHATPSVNEERHKAGYHAFIAGAEWARKETLREAAEVALSTPLTLDDIGYEAQVIAEAILELAKGAPDGQQ